MNIIRIAQWTPRNINPRKPLTGLALKLLAVGALCKDGVPLGAKKVL